MKIPAILLEKNNCILIALLLLLAASASAQDKYPLKKILDDEFPALEWAAEWISTGKTTGVLVTERTGNTLIGMTIDSKGKHSEPRDLIKTEGLVYDHCAVRTGEQLVLFALSSDLMNTKAIIYACRLNAEGNILSAPKKLFDSFKRKQTV